MAIEEYPHDLSQDEAQARLKALGDYWYKYGVKTTWKENTAEIHGKVFGLKFSATFSVQSDRLLLEKAKYSFLAEKLGGRKYVMHKLDEYMDPSKTLEELQSQAKR